MYDPADNWSLLVTSLGTRINAVLLAYLSNLESLKRLSELSWFDENADRSENKHNMKSLGAAKYQVRTHTKEMVLIAMSKTVEGLLNDINEICGLKLEFWKLGHLKPRFYKEVILLRLLNNAIKHQSSRVVSGTKSGNALIEQGFTDGEEITDIPIQILDQIKYVYIFLNDLIAECTDIKIEIPDTLTTEIFVSTKVHHKTGLYSPATYKNIDEW